ncbi:clavata3-like [Striga asiatica]|uniref:Clavata3-like n=1 Tax=Striga asiatica TaxID=4170 RepID=A0A5A7QZD1_STRAF|nr:clavata3-like [Striga asiatica]
MRADSNPRRPRLSPSPSQLQPARPASNAAAQHASPRPICEILGPTTNVQPNSVLQTTHMQSGGSKHHQTSPDAASKVQTGSVQSRSSGFHQPTVVHKKSLASANKFDLSSFVKHRNRKKKMGPQSENDIDPLYGVEKRLVPSGPNPLHH